MKTAALIVAAGTGERAGGKIPKQYQLLGGKPLLQRTVEAFLRHPGIEKVVVVIGEGHQEYFKSLGLVGVEAVIGGKTRQESVYKGLQALSADYVLIHDGARPLVSEAVISRVIEALKTHKAVVPVVAVVDTLKTLDGKTADRSHFMRAQTPQGFHYNIILDAHRNLSFPRRRESSPKNLDSSFRWNDVAGAPDDAALAEQAGVEVKLVGGDELNIKITTPTDFKIAEALI